MSKETVEINIDKLTEQVEQGMKRDELATFYNLPKSQMSKALKDAGLKIRKFHKPAFVLTTNSIDEAKPEVAKEEIENDTAVDPSSDGAITEGPGPETTTDKSTSVNWES